MLNVSEIRLIGLFLKIEKSRFISPGPGMVLRPALPRRLKHARGDIGGALGSPMGTPKLGGAGSQFADQNAALGAVGTEKH